MSHSPTRGDEEAKEYLEGWSATYELVRQGKSWSGNERHVCFLNTGDGAFTDISSVAGLDLPEDGRGLALVDWDRNGTLDLLFSNRTAPQVRAFRNRGPAGEAGSHFLALRLEGTRANRDAIGARVAVSVGGDEKPHLRTLRAGSGYLSQSSKWLHFGLGTASDVEEVVVRWPGGESESFSGASADGWYHLREGSGTAEPWQPPASAALEARPLDLPAPTQAARIVLAPRLPVLGLRFAPTTDLSALEPIETSGEGPLLINLWATWCGNCRHELEHLSASEGSLRRRDLRILALSVDEPGEHEAAFRYLEEIRWPFAAGLAPPALLDVLEILRQTVLDQPEGMVLPTSFLIDRESRLAVIYRGPVTADRLLADLDPLDDPALTDRERASLFPGRWYGGEPARDLELLANLMRSRGFLEIATTYLAQIPNAAERPEWDRRNKAQSFVELGRALLAEGKASEALSTLRQGLDLDPTYPPLRVELANALEASGDPVAAAESLRRALELDSEYAFAHYRLGMILVQTGSPDAGRESLERALATSRENDEVHALALFNLGVHHGEQRREPERAEAFVLRSLELEPEHLEAWRYLGVLQQRRGAAAEAAESFRRALELAPDDGARID